MTARMSLVFDTPAGRRNVTPGPDGIVVVGRSKECDVALDDDRVSRLHCCLVLGNCRDRFIVRELGSLNGTYLNGRPVEWEAELRVGEELQIGCTTCRAVAADSEPSPPARPTWLHSAAKPQWHAEPEEVIVFAEVPPAVPSRPIAASAAAGSDGGVGRPAANLGVGQPVTRAPAAHTAPMAHTAPIARAAPPAAKAPRSAAAEAGRKSRPRPARAGETIDAPTLSMNRDRERSPGRSTVLSNGVLEKLARMERTAAAVAPEDRRDSSRADSPTDRDIPLGLVQRLRPGGRWGPLRQALDWLAMLGIFMVVLQTAAYTALTVAALTLLGRDGLSVFIPFGHGGKQFTDGELVQIGMAMAAVAGGGLVVLASVWKHAEELLLFTLGGVALGIICGIVGVSTNRTTADVLCRVGMGLLAVATAAGVVILVMRAAAPARAGERLASGLAAGLFTGCLGLLGWAVVDGLPDSAELTIPMPMPVLPPQLIGAAFCAALGLLAWLMFLRAIVHAFGDDPTQRAFERFLIFHCVASSIGCLFLLLTNTGAAQGWTSGCLGLTAVLLLVIDYTVFVQVLRFTRVTI